MDEQLSKLIQLSVTGGILYDIAAVVYFLLKDTYKVAKLKSKLWYMFDGVKWKPVEEGPYYDLSRTVLKHYELYNNKKLQEKISLQQHMKTPQFNSDIERDNETLNQIEDELHKLQTILLKLKNVTFKESICKECLYMFYDSQFMMNLDKRDNLICFKNCTYDVVKKNVIESNKDNMLSVYIDLEYGVDIDDSEVEEFDSIMQRYIIFRKSIVKKRRPSNIYSVKLFQ